MTDRRRCQRQVAADGPWISARLRPGRDVALVNIGEGGALIDASIRLLPGTEAVLQLRSPDHYLAIPGRVLRCEVIALDPSLGIRYRGAVCFQHRIVWPRLSEQRTRVGYDLPDPEKGFDGLAGNALPGRVADEPCE